MSWRLKACPVCGCDQFWDAYLEQWVGMLCARTDAIARKEAQQLLLNALTDVNDAK